MTAITDEITRLEALQKGLKLEIAGIVAQPLLYYTTVKREFGFVGGKERVLEQLEAHIFKLRQKELDFGN